MKNTFSTLVLLFVAILFANHTHAQHRFDFNDMIKREKQNLYQDLTDLSKDQKTLLEGIYDEYLVSFNELREEIRSSGDYRSMRTKMEGLQKEKHLIIKDVLNDDQYAVYKKLLDINDDDPSQKPASITVTGKVIDGTDQSELIGATVLFVNVSDSTLSKFGSTDINGQFTIKGLRQSFHKVVITSMGYQTYINITRIGDVDVSVGSISLQPDVKMLNEVEVTAEVVPMEMKGDTVVYNADAYKVNPDASTKDLVSKMAGIQIDANGVTANGETVQQVLVDGKRFFGQDPLLSLNTIPAEVVKRVEVFDQASEQSQFTGINDGNTTKTMNVVTKDSKKNGQFGKLYSGYGTDNLYTAGGNVNLFKDDRRITLIGMSNNINQQNFSNEDLVGAGGGGRGFRGRNSGPLMTANQQGVTQTNSFGVNYIDNIGKKLSVEGSYFFNQTDNRNFTKTDRELYLQDDIQFYDEEREALTENMNHRLNMRVNYDINENNRLLIRPRLSFQDNISNNYTNGLTRNDLNEILNLTENNLNNGNAGYNFSNSIMFQHKFKKIGRSFSIDIDTQLSTTDRESNYEEFALDSLSQYLTDEAVSQAGIEFTYSEPVGLNGQLSASYEVEYSERMSDRKTYFIDTQSSGSNLSPALSNNFTTGQTIHKPEIRLTNRSFGKFYSIGLEYQNAVLDNTILYPIEDKINNRFNSVLPTIMGRIEFAPGKDMFFRYAANTDIPSLNQLQNVVDNSNPLFWSVGNPNLNQAYSHSLFARLSLNNVDKGRNLSNFTRVQFSENYITNSTFFMLQDSTLSNGLIMPRGSQLAVPVNLDGYWNVINNTSYSLTLTKLKSKLNTGVRLGLVRNPGLTNEVLNYAETRSVGGELSLVSNISEKIDFSISYNPGYNSVVNTVQKNRDTNYTNHILSGKVNLIFGKDFVFRSNISFQDYKGVSDEFDFQYTLWNMALAKKFLKNNAGELELSVFDLLKQNQSISQVVAATYFEETVTEVLQQYFMLKFTYNFRKFK